MAVTPSVVALLTPVPVCTGTRCCRARDRAVVLSGVRRALLARARPSSAVRSVTPLAPAVQRDMGRARALEGAPAQPRTCTTRPRLKCSRVHVVHRPDAQARDRAVAPRSPRGAPQPAAGGPKAGRRPPYRAHWPVSGRPDKNRGSRYRASCAPQGRGRNTPAHKACPERSRRAARRSPRTKHATLAG
jgi:hypothetical protein